MLNSTILMGRLTADPQLKQTPTGVPVVSFTIAVEDDVKGPDGEKKTDFFDVEAWRGTAEFISVYFKKGRVIIVDGKLKSDVWKDDADKTHKRVKVIAEKAYFGDSKKDGGDNVRLQSQSAYPISGGLSAPAPTQMPHQSYKQQSFEELPTINDDDLPF